MKKITFLFFLAMSFYGYSQCTVAAQYPAGDVTAVNDGLTQNINGCNYTGEYAVLVGLTIGEDYQFGIAEGATEKYVTVIDNADGTTVLAFGPSPLTVNAITVAAVQLHYTDDAACATTNNCHTSYYTNLSQAPVCGAPSNLAATPTDLSAVLSWNAPATGTPVDYNWEVVPQGNAQGVGVVSSGTVAALTDTAAGLTAVTPYSFYVQTNCGVVDGTSAYAGPFDFTTTNTPPANDDCANAIAIACAGNATGSTIDASDSGMGSNGAADVWYSFTGTGAAEDVTLDLCASSYDTYIRVYDGCAGTEIAGNDDFCATQSQVTFASDGTSTYYIMIEGYGTNTGAYDLTVSCVPAVAPPANDECGAATAITLGVTLVGETTVGATQSAGEQPSCDLFGSIADVWYSFVAPASGEATVQTTITGTSDQANVAIYSDCSNTQAMELAGGCLDGNGGESVAVTGLTPSNTYYVKVWSDGATSRNAQRIEGTFDLFVEDTVILNVDNFDLSDNFRYFPNPVKDMLTVSAQNNIESLSIVNMLGQTVKTVQPNLNNYNLDFKDLSSGVYFVKATINNIEGTFRVIKE